MVRCTLTAEVFSLLLLTTLLPQLEASKAYQQTTGIRRFLRQANTCGTCPSRQVAVSQCAALEESVRTTIRNTLISSCGSSSVVDADSQEQCCTTITGQWDDYLHCLCAGEDFFAGIGAFVDTTAIVEACGCDGEAGSASGTSGSIQSIVGGGSSSSGTTVSVSVSRDGEQSEADELVPANEPANRSAEAPASSTPPADPPPEEIQELLDLQGR
jgi:hypothetical protein